MITPLAPPVRADLHYLLPHFALSPLPGPTTNINTIRIYWHHRFQNHCQHQHKRRPLQHQHVKQCETMWNNTQHAPKKSSGFTILGNSMKGGAISPAEKGRVLHCIALFFWMFLVVFVCFCCPRPRLLVTGSIQSAVLAITFLNSVGNGLASCVLPCPSLQSSLS